MINSTVGKSLVVLLAIFAYGCATNRSVMEISTEVSENPDSGYKVKFVRVSDLRKFQIEPSDPYTPSLRYGEIDDISITSRAIARKGQAKKTVYGTEWGDILLPEGQTVAGLMERSLAKAFRDGGYLVISKGDASYPEAMPLELEIDQFWGWLETGSWRRELHFQVGIRIIGTNGPFASGMEFRSQITKRTYTPGERSWGAVIRLALDEINEDITENIAALQSNREPGSASRDQNAEAENVADRLRRIARLRDEGLISDEEYQRIRTQILEAL